MPSPTPPTKPPRYALGCPFWSFADWRGSLYSEDARPADFLAQYARVFGTVEGNTTFWSVPNAQTVERWRDAVPADFRFCLKLPREITHERMLWESERALTQFLHAVEPLGERLGPFLVQLPPGFGPEDLPRLVRFLDAVPRDFDWTVEFRHPALFDHAALAKRCDDMLAERGHGRCIMDTRALRAGDANHPDILNALHKKPNLPLREEPIGRHPLVRFVGHPDPVVNDPFLDEWAERIARWTARGLEPFFFMHTPSNLRTPEFARDLHRRIAKRIELAPLADFPGECGELATGQLSLLS